jgi:hypothetical protein
MARSFRDDLPDGQSEIFLMGGMDAACEARAVTADAMRAQIGTIARPVVSGPISRGSRDPLLFLLLSQPEKFVKETLLPLQRRLLLFSRLDVQAEIGCDCVFRDHHRACKRHQKNSGAGKREDDLERRQAVFGPSNHDLDSPAVWLILD